MKIKFETRSTTKLDARPVVVKLSEIGDVPMWFRLLFLCGGIFIMLVSLDLIPTDPRKFNAPRWIVFLCGLAFFAAGMLTVMARIKSVVGYLLVIQIFFVAFGGVAAWIALFGKGSQCAMGPIQFGGWICDSFGRTLAALGAIILLCFSVQGFRLLRRALQGETVDEIEK